jgi:membrane protease YdiL (CAAX protease family)
VARAPLSVKRGPLIARFLAGAFVPAWALCGTFFVLGRVTGKEPPLVVMAVLAMLFPAVSAIGVQKLAAREPIRKPLGIVLRPTAWMLVAWLLPAVIAIGALLVGALLPGQSLSLDMWARRAATTPPDELAELRHNAASLPVHPAVFSLGQGLLTGLTINAVLGLGEEIGWRGFLYKELATYGGRARSLGWVALVTGLVWGVWNAPLVLQGQGFPEHRLAGAAVMVLYCVAASPVYAWLRMRSGTVVVPAIFHGSLNATGFLPLMLTRGGDDLTVGTLALPGLVVLLVVDVLVWRALRAPVPPPVEPEGLEPFPASPASPSKSPSSSEPS